MRKLSIDAIKHGETQIQKMLKDRPVMKKHVARKDAIWRWTVQKFAGEDLSETIDWNNHSPYHGAKASHIYPCKSERGYICIRKNLSFETSWAGAIFELHNISFYSEFKRTIQKAYKGHLKKREFITKMAQIEFKALKKSEKFYKNIWHPWAKQKNLSTNPSEWNVGAPAKFKDWIKYFDKSSNYPWKIYSDFYDDHLEKWALADMVN